VSVADALTVTRSVRVNIAVFLVAILIISYWGVAGLSLSIKIQAGSPQQVKQNGNGT